jgi:uncharacterized protein
MASLSVLADGLELDEPTMVEGLPGIGLVGKIAADHLVDAFEMTHFANVHCEGLPKVAVFNGESAELTPPVRLYADEERNLLVLQSDVPVSPPAANEFAECVSGWYDDLGLTPIYLSGQPTEKGPDVPALHGVGVGSGVELVEDAGIDVPTEPGLVSGPTGALMSYAVEHDQRAVGLVVESDPQFPDPEAARVIIKDGIEPLTGLDVPVDDLVEHAEEIRNAKQRLAQRMQEADEESTRTQPLRMYQ